MSTDICQVSTRNGGENAIENWNELNKIKVETCSGKSWKNAYKTGN